MWHFLNKLWRSVLLILCLHSCNNLTTVNKFFNNYVKIQIEKTKIVCLAFTHVLESTISRKKITTRRRVKHRYMVMTISNHGRDSHLASQSVHFIWKSRLNENSQPPLPMLQLTKYLLLLPERICNSVTQIDRIGRVPNCDQTLRSICLISNIRHWFWQRHHSNETWF